MEYREGQTAVFIYGSTTSSDPSSRVSAANVVAEHRPCGADGRAGVKAKKRCTWGSIV